VYPGRDRFPVYWGQHSLYVPVSTLFLIFCIPSISTFLCRISCTPLMGTKVAVGAAPVDPPPSQSVLSFLAILDHNSKVRSPLYNPVVYFFHGVFFFFFFRTQINPLPNWCSMLSVLLFFLNPMCTGHSHGLIFLVASIAMACSILSFFSVIWPPLHRPSDCCYLPLLALRLYFGSTP